MTGPISGVNPQQASLAKTFKPEGNEQQDAISRNRDEFQTSEQERIEVKGTATSQNKLIEETREKQESEDKKAESRNQNFAANSNSNTTQRRGSLVDVVV